MPRERTTLENKIVEKVKKEIKHELGAKVLHLTPYRSAGIKRRKGGILPLLPMGAAALAGWLLPKLMGGGGSGIRRRERTMM